MLALQRLAMLEMNIDDMQMRMLLRLVISHEY